MTPLSLSCAPVRTVKVPLRLTSATLQVESATTLNGSGLIDLSSGGSLVGTPGAVLTNSSNSIVTNNGPANIGGSGWELINAAGGEIAAIGPSASLTIDLSGSGGFVSNGGQIVASSGSMAIEGTIRNTSAGKIFAHIATVTLEGSGNIVGGTLSALGGVYDVPTAFTLDGGSAVVPTNKMITIHAPVAVEGTLNLLGAINNISLVELDSIAGGDVLVAQSVGKQTTVTLEGHGTVGLSDAGAGDVPNAITGGGAPVTLANFNNTINGGGIIGGAEGSSSTIKPAASSTRPGLPPSSSTPARIQ
jgi:hypothetical protein